MTDPTPETPTAGRGRPRSTATIERDEKVLAIVSGAGEEGISRSDIAAKLQADNPEAKPSEAYLSLFRLRKENKVQRKADGGKHRWVATPA